MIRIGRKGRRRRRWRMQEGMAVVVVGMEGEKEKEKVEGMVVGMEVEGGREENNW